MGLLHLVQVTTLLPLVQGGRWVFLGGFSGLEEGGDRASGHVELLELTGNNANQEKSKFADRFEWCSGNFSKAPIDLGGHTMSEVNVISYVNSKVGNADFVSGHHTTQFHRILVCGGADDKYVVRKKCLWWQPERDAWEEGPTMMSPRYSATAISWPERGMVWMMGGRDGSTILQDNEVLIYPEIRSSSGSELFKAKRWDWAHKKQKNIEVWNQAVPGNLNANPKILGMKMLPMALTGHCAFKVGNGNGAGVLVLGGGTVIEQDELSVVQNSPPVPTDHVHFYHIAGDNNNKWSSTLISDEITGSRQLTKMGLPRMNHACLAINNMVYVAGGVTNDTTGQRLVVDKVERYDFANNAWIFEADLPWKLTGVKLISVGGRPTVVGRYGEEKTERLLRYSEDKTWVTLPTNMLDGRSDFQVLQKLPNKISIYPDMNSKTTRLNPGSGSDGNWRNLFGKVIDGKRTVWKGNTQQQQPWVQLDLVVETFVSKVIFETGNCAVCDGSDDVAQPVEVRLSSDPVPRDELKNTQITIGHKCSPDVDGTASASETNCGGGGGRSGRYLIIQLNAGEDGVGAAGAPQLAIRHISIEGTLDPPCSPPSF